MERLVLFIVISIVIDAPGLPYGSEIVPAQFSKYATVKCGGVAACVVSKPDKSVGTRSPIHCALECSRQQRLGPEPCVGVNYRKPSGQCEMFSYVNASTNFTKNEPECQYLQPHNEMCYSLKMSVLAEVVADMVTASLVDTSSRNSSSSTQRATTVNSATETPTTYAMSTMQYVGECPHGWNGSYNENCYYVSPRTTLVNQASARSACLGLGADLTSIVNQDEFNYISNISYVVIAIDIDSLLTDSSLKLATRTQSDYWIGLMKTSSAATTDTTYFLDLSLTPYRPPWRSGEPNDATTCTRLGCNITVTPYDVRLRDTYCDVSYSYVCKRALGYNRTVVSNLGFGVPPVISINSWIVIQNKLPPGNSSILFSTQRWIDYRDGFGDLMTTITNYWIGNKHINSLTTSAQYKLRVEILYPNGVWYSAEYGSFYIGVEANNFPLAVSGFSGAADDALQFTQSTMINAAANGQKFSTSDRDNDMVGSINCAQTQGGGWWYGSTCSMPNVNVNGLAYWYDGRSTQETAPNVSASMMKIQLAN